MSKKQKKILLDFDNKEIKLIQDFKQHPIFCKINQISEEDFLKILIQRMFVSLAITPIYELAINASNNEYIISTIRDILYEEYPRGANNIPLTSHRENLKSDLISLGASSEFIHSQAILPGTEESILSAFKIIFCQDQIGILTFVRFWGEILVSEEYICLWKRIKNKLSKDGKNDKIESIFYWFHIQHDNKRISLSYDDNIDQFKALSHSDKLTIHLRKLISSDDTLRRCIEIEEKVQKMKLGFYNQFLYLLD